MCFYHHLSFITVVWDRRVGVSFSQMTENEGWGGWGFKALWGDLLNTSESLICLWNTWGSCEDANSDSVSLVRGLRFCIPNRLPGNCWFPGCPPGNRLNYWHGLGIKSRWPTFPVCTWQCRWTWTLGLAKETDLALKKRPAVVLKQAEMTLRFRDGFHSVSPSLCN